MKKIVLLIFFLFVLTSNYAQINSIKGRILGVPEYFTMGIGYERMLNENMSFQLLFNRYGYDIRDTDGSAEFTNSFVPETRFYFGKKKEETLNKAAFWGVFCELSKTNVFPGGEQLGERIFLGGNKKKLNPGILIGKNGEILERWYAEFYFGVKYKFVFESSDYSINAQSKVTEKNYFGKPDIRLGMNIGCRF